MKLLNAILFSLAIFGDGAILLGQSNHSGTSSRNMVASVHPLATEAGIAAFKKGGNAIDAAVAAAATLGVVDGYNSGIGGGCFILIRTADGNIVAIDGREMAPAAAHRNMYLENGVPQTNPSQIGPRAIAVPGAILAFEQAIRDFGKLQLADIMLPAADIAENGFTVTQIYSDKLKSERRQLLQFPGSAGIFLKNGTSIYSAGETIRQADLARTYRSIALQGTDWFYRGEFATLTERWMRDNGGLINQQDFANYKTKIREPIRTTYREYEIIGFPPPSSGGVHVAQILNILEPFDIAQIARENPVELRHVVAEAMKLAFADRAYWLGDPDYVDVPRQLISKSYAKDLAARIDRKRTTSVDSHGTPPSADSDFFEKHTTHLTAADEAGNWVAITSTINTRFGSKVVVPGLGVVMNNQMDDFSIAPGTPNAYRLIGSENNAIAPGKRPLSSMSPTIVLKDGQPIFTVGAAGGPKIITQVVWAIINHLDLKMNAADAIAQPRVHHQWSPDKLMVEQTLTPALRTGLTDAGHRLEVVKRDYVGVSQAISFDPESGIFTGSHDPRVPGSAAGEQ